MTKVQDYGANRSCIFYLTKNYWGGGKIYFEKINFYITKL